jgi:hypothetical protein
VLRSIRRYPDGGAVVSVRVRGRDHRAMVADMVDGVVVANGLVGAEGDAARRAMLDVALVDAEGVVDMVAA